MYSDELVQFKNNNQLTARYGYDPFNRRLWKEQYQDKQGNPKTNPQRTYFLYSDEGLIGESTQAITITGETVAANTTPEISTQYGPTPDGLFSTHILFTKTKNSNKEPTIAYYHYDHLSTPMQATDKAGNTLWSASCEAFGKAKITTPNSSQEKPTMTSNLRFPGQYEDEETGLHYNFNRYYDPETGRYITQDPIRLEGGINFYQYVGGDPISLIDPEGLAGKIPKNYGKGKPLPPPEKLSNDTTQRVKENQQVLQDQIDAVKCAFGLVACEAIREMQKALLCELSICTTYNGNVFYSGPKAMEQSVYDPATTTCKCIRYALDPNYKGGPPPGLGAG